MRIFPAYCPFSDAATNHPLWRIEVTNLHGLGEVFDRGLKLALVDPGSSTDAEAVGHAVAHLDLGHADTGDTFTDQQELDADDLADLKAQPDWSGFFPREGQLGA